MHDGDAFVAKTIEQVAIANGVPKMTGDGDFYLCRQLTREFVAHRVADRLIQQERKAGNIKFNGKLWIAVSAFKSLPKEGCHQGHKIGSKP